MKPVFYDPDKWSITEIYFASDMIAYKDMTALEYGDSYSGDMRMKVGEYENHDLYINAQVDISAGEKFGENGAVENEMDIYIAAFPDSNIYDFDFEPMHPTGAFERDMNKMLKDHEDICLSAINDIEDYFEKHQKEIGDMFFKEVQKMYPEEYEKYIALSEAYIGAEEEKDR